MRVHPHFALSMRLISRLQLPRLYPYRRQICFSGSPLKYAFRALRSPSRINLYTSILFTFLVNFFQDDTLGLDSFHPEGPNNQGVANYQNPDPKKKQRPGFRKNIKN